MDPERRQQIDALLAAALERAPDERSLFLDSACGEDADLRRTVETLLAADAKLEGFLETPAAAAEVAAAAATRGTTAEIGESIGPYRIEREIDHGGMGTVYLAVRADDAFERRVAIKLLNPGMASANLVRRFRSERQILASLDHPYIARLFEGGATEDGRPYLVMEYIEGLPVDEYCDRSRLPLRQRLELFRKICAAVHYAHQNLVVHRDVKPSNILVDENGEPRLLDFGIAKLLDPEAFPYTVDATVTGLHPMTPHYASPEQVRGEAITTASDVYSLGVLLYKLLTGRLPHRLAGLPRREIERVLSTEEPSRPSVAVAGLSGASDVRESEPTPDAVSRSRATRPQQLRRQLTGDLDNIVLMALRKEPGRRYGSVEQLSGDLRRHLEGLPVTARQSTLAYQVGSFVRRHKLAVVLAASMLAMVMIFAAAMARQARFTARQRDLAELERDKAEQVSAFLVDLFEVVDPGEARGNTITAREVLDRGAAQVRRELANQPEVQASLLDAIGTVYLNLGLYEQSAPLLESSLETRETRHGADHPEVARSLHHLGTLYRHQGRYDEAEPLLRRALAVREESLGPAHAGVGETLQQMAILERQQGRYAEAEALLERALEIFRRQLGPEHPNVARCLRVLSGVRMNQGRYDEAEPLLQSALAIDEKVHGEDHLQTAVGLFDLAKLHAGRAEYDRAEPYLRRILPIFTESLGEDHPWTADIHLGLAYLAKGRGDLTKAEPGLRRALEIYRGALGIDHARVANCFYELGDVIFRQGRLVEAEPLLHQALAIRERILETGHPSIGESLHGLGRLLQRRGRSAEAERLLRRAFEIWELHPKNTDTQGIPETWAAYLRAAGREREAAEIEAPTH